MEIPGTASIQKEAPSWLGSWANAGMSALCSIATKVKESHSDFQRQIEKDENEAVQKQMIIDRARHIAPWNVTCPGKEHLATKLSQEIKELSKEEAIFKCAPPSDDVYPLDLQVASLVMERALEVDQRLQKMRFKLVPRRLSEEAFTRIFLHQVALIRQKLGVEPLPLEKVEILTSERQASVELTAIRHFKTTSDADETSESSSQGGSGFEPEQLESMLNELEYATIEDKSVKENEGYN